MKLTPILLVFLSFAGPVLAQDPICHNGALVNEEMSHPLVVEIANTYEKRQTGLMNRDHLSDTSGMLFIFDNHDRQPFWMKNTLIPLDIVHLGFDGAILQTLKGQPHDTTLLMPDVAAQLVLEVRQNLIDDLKATHFILKDITPCP